MSRAMLVTSLLLFAYLAFVAGCGGAARGRFEKLDPQGASTKAMEAYDRNSDGKLAMDELRECPPLAASGQQIDRNGDSVVTREEIQARLEAIDAGADFMALDVVVTSKGRPLVGAEVTFSPESFMGDRWPSYSGATLEGGSCPLLASEGKLAGIPSGFYQVKIVHAGQALNAVRGVEIADDASGNRLQISL